MSGYESPFESEDKRIACGLCRKSMSEDTRVYYSNCYCNVNLNIEKIQLRQTYSDDHMHNFCRDCAKKIGYIRCRHDYLRKRNFKLKKELDRVKDELMKLK